MAANWTDLVSGLDEGLLAAFGVDVLFQALDLQLPPATVRAIVDSGHDTEETAPGVYLILFVRPADLPAAPQNGDTWTIAGEVFTCYRVDLDQQGGARLGVRQ